MPSSKRRRMPFFSPATSIVGEFVHGRRSGRPLPVTSASGCPSRFAGGQRTAAACHQSPGHGPAHQVMQAWPFHANQVASFGHEGWAVHAPVSERLMRLPVSQRLKPQSSMPARFCTSPFASSCAARLPFVGVHAQRAPLRISSSKQERVGSHQPPNPSFKRTCLRQAA